MVGSMLAALGVDMGRRSIPADERNARGYFEDADVVAFHGRDGCGTPTLPPGAGIGRRQGNESTTQTRPPG